MIRRRQPPGAFGCQVATLTGLETVNRRVLVAALALQVSGPIAPFLAGALAVQMTAELGFGEAALGVSLGMAFASTGVASVAGGRLADRIGWRRASLIAALGSVIALVGVALLARSYLVLTALLALAGGASGLSLPASNLALVREMPVGRHALLFGMKMAAVPFATMFAGATVPLIALTVGWRWAFVAAGIFPIVALLTVPRGPGPPPRVPNVRADGVVPSEKVLTSGLVLLACGAGLGSFTFGALNAFFVVYAVSVGVGEGKAGVLVAAGSAVSICVRVSAGWIAGRVGSRGFPPVVGMLSAGAFGFALVATGQPSWLIGAALVTYGAGWGWAGLFQYGVVLHHPHAPASATGIVAVGLGTGLTVGPVLFGLALPHFGYRSSWLGLAGVALLAAAFVLAGTIRLPPPVRAQPRKLSVGVGS